MIQAKNEIAARWVKIASDLQSQLIRAEEDKINLSVRIASLTAEKDQLRKALTAIADDCEAEYPPSYGAIKYAAHAVLQPKEDK